MVVGPYHLVQSSLSSHHISHDEWYAQANSFNGRRHVQLKEYNPVHRVYILAAPISTPIPLDLEQDNLWLHPAPNGSGLQKPNFSLLKSVRKLFDQFWQNLIGWLTTAS